MILNKSRSALNVQSGAAAGGFRTAMLPLKNSFLHHLCVPCDDCGPLPSRMLPSPHLFQKFSGSLRCSRCQSKRSSRQNVLTTRSRHHHMSELTLHLKYTIRIFSILRPSDATFSLPQASLRDSCGDVGTITKSAVEKTIGRTCKIIHPPVQRSPEDDSNVPEIWWAVQWYIRSAS